MKIDVSNNKMLDNNKYLVSAYGKRRYDVDINTGCWIWAMTVSSKRPRIKENGRLYAADLWMYKNFYREYSKSKKLIRSCNNYLCVNPDHGELVDRYNKCEVGCTCYLHYNKENRSRAMKRVWQEMSDETKIQRSKKISESHITTPRIYHTFKETKLESYLADLLKIINVEFKKQVWIKHGICVDFLIEDKRFSNLPIVLEANGCYWHSCRRCQKVKGLQPRNDRPLKDLKRKEEIENYGYTVIEIWEHELPASSDGKVIF